MPCFQILIWPLMSCLSLSLTSSDIHHNCRSHSVIETWIICFCRCSEPKQRADPSVDANPCALNFLFIERLVLAFVGLTQSQSATDRRLDRPMSDGPNRIVTDTSYQTRYSCETLCDSNPFISFGLSFDKLLTKLVEPSKLRYLCRCECA